MKAQAHKPHQNHSSINDSARCQHRTTKGRCTMLAVDPKRQLCFDHARQALKLRQEADFAKYLVKEASGFQTACGINHALGDLYILLAQGLITPRRASVLAHILSLLLRTFPAIDTDKSPEADRDLTPYSDADATDADSTNESAGSAGILPADPEEESDATTGLALDHEEEEEEAAKEQEEDEQEQEEQEQEEQEGQGDDEQGEEDDLEALLEDEEENEEDLLKTSKPN